MPAKASSDSSLEIDLKREWTWDSLGQNPRFQIAGGPPPKVIYK